MSSKRLFFVFLVIPAVLTGLAGCPPAQLQLRLSKSYHAFGPETRPWSLDLWAANGTMAFTIEAVDTWLRVSPAQGQSTGSDDRVTVSVSAALNAPISGYARSELVVRWGDPAADPAEWNETRLPVTAMATKAYAFDTDVAPWTFDLWGLDDAQAFAVETETDWLQVTPAEGESAGAEAPVPFTVTPDSDALDAGCNDGELVIRWGEPGTDPDDWDETSVAVTALATPVGDGCDPVTVTVKIPASKDGTLYEGSQNNIDKGLIANGAGEYLFAGRTQKGILRRGAIMFDVEEYIPTEATISSATLTMYASDFQNPGTDTGAQTIDIALAAKAWGEGSSNAGGSEENGAIATANDVTWKHAKFAQVFWAAEGGDFSGNVHASQSVTGEGSYKWTSEDVAVDVQYWLDSPSRNYGWLIFGNEKVGEESSKADTYAGTVKRFASRENTTEDCQPLLTVKYTYQP